MGAHHKDGRPIDAGDEVIKRAIQSASGAAPFIVGWAPRGCLRR